MRMNNKNQKKVKKSRKNPKIDIDKLEKKLVNRKIVKSNFSTKLVAFIIFTSLSLAFGVFAYFYAGVVEGKLGVEGEATFTISKALAHGNKPGFIVLTFLGFGYLLYLLCLRGPIDMFIRRVFFLFISFSLLLSLLWFTPSYNSTLHYALASIIFTFILFFNLVTYYLFYKRFDTDRNTFLMLGLSNMLAYVCLIVFAVLRGSLESDIFAGFEILFAVLFLSTIMIIGYY